MFIRVDRDRFGDDLLGAPPAKYKPPFDTGGMPVGEGHAKDLLTILAGPSRWQPYLQKVMAQQTTPLKGSFLRIVTSISQVPPHLRHLFAGGTVAGETVGGTVDRWTRTIYMVPAPGRRVDTRLEYALHECVHLFADPHEPLQGTCPQPCIGTFQRRFETGFGEGLTQVITEDIMNAQGISLYYRDRPYKEFTPVVRDLIGVFGLDAMARAYFFGQVDALYTSLDARWGTAWHLVKVLTTGKKTDKARAKIRELEAAYTVRLRQMMPQGPTRDFPTPSRHRLIA